MLLFLSMLGTILAQAGEFFPPLVEEPWAFKGWHLKRDASIEVLDVAFLEKVEVNCSETELTPTDPSMKAKEYFNLMWGRYDHFKLKPGSPNCVIWSTSKRRKCLQPDSLYSVIVSDLYRDNCGNIYRGYVQVTYRQSKQEMTQLFSPGRTMILRPGSSFENDYIPGPTTSVPASTFLFLTK